MLSHLSIENFGLINKLSIDFHDQLNILTGETGAGKSIVFGALRFALGGKLNVSQLRLSDQPCVIEAVFDLSSHKILTQEILNDPQHPYTRALLKSIPKSGQRHRSNSDKLPTIEGAPPDPSFLPHGCIFHPRCQSKVKQCEVDPPKIRNLSNPRREVACHEAPFKMESIV